VHDLIGPDDVCGGNTSPSSTNIESLGELDEFGPGRVDAADENRHLQADAGRTSGWRRRRQKLLPFKDISLQGFSLGTKELVRVLASRMPVSSHRRGNKVI